MSIPRWIFDRLEFIATARKAFDAKPKWQMTSQRLSGRWQIVVALRLDGVLRGGVSMRLRTPVDVWDDDVYGQLEVKLPGMNRLLRLEPVEWRPLHHHDNPANAPAPHRNQRLWDRWHPFDLNAAYGLQSFDQSGPGIAVPLPYVPVSFSEYTKVCGDLWKSADMYDLEPPPWSRKML